VSPSSGLGAGAAGGPGGGPAVTAVERPPAAATASATTASDRQGRRALLILILPRGNLGPGVRIPPPRLGSRQQSPQYVRKPHAVKAFLLGRMIAGGAERGARGMGLYGFL